MLGRAPFALSALGCLLAAALSGASPLPPKPTRFATDRAGVLAPARLEALNERLAAFERETSNQVLVLVDRRLPPGTTLEEMGAAAIRTWGVGQKGRDNGVLFFVFVDDRTMRVEVGYGLEGAIPDAVAKRITNDVVKPFFKRQDYAGGVEAGANALVAAARREGFKGSGQTVAPRPGPVRKAVPQAVPRPARPAGLTFAAFWELCGRTLAIGAGLSMLFLFVFRIVSRRGLSEEAALYGRVGMAAWGGGTAAASALQGEWLFAGIAFVVGLLFLVDWKATGDGMSSSYESSSGTYESSSSSYSSSSPSSSSDFSGGGGDGGGGGSSDRW